VIVAFLILAGFAAAFVLMLVDVDRLRDEVEFLDAIWADDAPNGVEFVYKDGGGWPSSDRGEHDAATTRTPAAAAPYNWDAG